MLEQGYVWRGLTPDSYGYEQCLQYVLHGLYRKLDPGDRLFTRILLECPEITEGKLVIVKSFISLKFLNKLSFPDLDS